MSKLTALTLVWLVVVALSATTLGAGAESLTAGNAELSPTTVVANEPVTVSATVTNPGDEQVEQVVAVAANGSVVATQNVSLAPGESTSVTSTPSFATPGTYELAIEGAVAGILTVEPPPRAELRVTNATLAEQAIREDETVAVEATVENPGDAEGTEPIELMADGAVVATTTVSVPPGEATSVTFAPRFEAPGSYDITVGDVAAGTLTVADDPRLIENCTTITEPGTYRLGENLTAPAAAEACIAIETSDVELAGQGYVVNGTTGYGTDAKTRHFGIAVSAPNETVLSNVTVRNVTVTEWTHGVEVHGATDVAVRDVTAEHNRVGIAFKATRNATVRRGRVRDNAKHGVRIRGQSDAVTVRGSTIVANGGRGIFASQVANTTVEGVLTAENHVGVMVQDATGTVIRESTVRDNAKAGVFLRVTNRTAVRENDIHGGSVGIRVRASHGAGHESGTSHEDDGCDHDAVVPGSTTVAGNTITDVAGVGIAIVGTDHDVVVDNQVQNASSWALRAAAGATNLTVRRLWMDDRVSVSADGADMALRPADVPPPRREAQHRTGIALEAETTTATGTWSNGTIGYRQSTIDNASIDESTLHPWRHDGTWSLLGTPTGWQYNGAVDAWIPLAVEGPAVDTDANRVDIGQVDPGRIALLAGHPQTRAAAVSASLETTTVPDGEPVPVNATVGYDGPEPGTLRLDLTANGDIVESRTVTVSNETLTVRFTPHLPPGDYEMGVSGATAGSVTVVDVTSPLADAGPERNVDVGETVVFDGGGSTDDVGIDSYAWTFPDGSTGVGETASHTFDSSGAYDVDLTVEDAAENADSDSLTVLVGAEAESGGGGHSASGAASAPTTTPPAADIGLVDASLETPTIAAGEPAVISATLANDGDADGEYALETLVDGRVVESVFVAVPAGTTVTVTLTPPVETPGAHRLAVNGLALDTLAVRAPETATPTAVGAADTPVTPSTADQPDGETALPTVAAADETPAADPGPGDGPDLLGLALMGGLVAAIAALARRRWA